MRRRIIWASLLTVVIWTGFQHLFPSQPLEAAATAVVFAIMFGLVYAVERLSVVVRRLVSAAAARRAPAPPIRARKTDDHDQTGSGAGISASAAEPRDGAQRGQ